MAFNAVTAEASASVDSVLFPGRFDLVVAEAGADVDEPCEIVGGAVFAARTAVAIARVEPVGIYVDSGRYQDTVRTTLVTPVDDSETTFVVSGHIGFYNGAYAKFGTEVVRIVSGADTNTWVVDRGQWNTDPVPHLAGE